MDFLGCPVVGGMGSIPEQGTQIPHAVQYSQKKKKKDKIQPHWLTLSSLIIQYKALFKRLR